MPPEAQTTRRGVSLRAVLLGSLLIFGNVYWVIKVEGIWHWGHPTAVSLMWNVVFSLLVLILLNAGLRRVAPRWAFTQGEFITIYVLLAIASALAGHDTLQLGIPSLVFPWLNATDANQWESLFWRQVPKWLTVGGTEFQREEVLPGWQDPHSNFWVWENVRAFAGPVAWWVAFILALGLVLTCISVLVRRQWTEHERLGYPIIQIPMAITENGGAAPIWRNRIMWIGFALAAALDILNGLHVLYPSIPQIIVRHDRVEHWIRAGTWRAPWNALGDIWMPLYPFIIALGFFLPLDLSFSIWFFYLFRKLQYVAARAFPVRISGLVDPGQLPYVNEQSFGAWLAYFGYTVYMGRRYFAELVRRAVAGTLERDATGELVSHRVAFIGIGVGMAFIIYFCLKANMSLAVILVFFGFFLLLSTAISRMRAELGPPAHEMAFGMHSGQLIINFTGPKALGNSNLVMFTMFYWFTGRGYRTTPMPHQLEAFKMAETAKMDPKRLGWAMALAFLLGGFASYLWSIHMSYQVNDSANVMTAHNWGEWNQLAAWVRSDEGPAYDRISFMSFGIILSLFLMVMRTRYTWWPFHPAGYALCMNFGVEYFWTCILIAWLIKAAILRWGGYKPYQKAIPFMIGVVLGEYCVGAFWSVMSVILQKPMYDFCPG